MTAISETPAPREATIFQPPSPLRTAVLFLIFNRPQVTETVFRAIRAARPPRLYVAADGARSHKAGEAEKCALTRRVIEQVDWPCEVFTLFRDTNLGCRAAVSGAISWFFEHEEEGIILEDDCLPVPSFFWFCEELLSRYRHDERIGQISGTAFFADEFLNTATTDYIYSRHFAIWGWATWRRVWKTYDHSLSLWPEFSRERLLPAAYPVKNERMARSLHNDKVLNNTVDTWDYQWTFANASQSKLAVVPRSNLIVNIGFGDDATHTTFRHPVAPLSASDIALPTTPPTFVHPDFVYDRSLSRRLYRGLFLSKVDSVVSRLRDRQFLRAKSRALDRAIKACLKIRERPDHPDRHRH